MKAIITHTGNAEATADVLRQALQRHGHRVMTTWDLDDPDARPEVWVIPCDRTFGAGQFVRRGQQVVVDNDGSYRIETVAAEVTS